MADEATAETPTPRKTRTRRAAPAKPKAEPAPEPETKEEKDEVRAPKRARLAAERARLLSVRRTINRRRPVFGRQAANRYFRIGRDGAWRRPRGLQSKQRRHYGYRPQVVSIGYRSPAAVERAAEREQAPALRAQGRPLRRAHLLGGLRLLRSGGGCRLRRRLLSGARLRRRGLRRRRGRCVVRHQVASLRWARSMR